MLKDYIEKNPLLGRFFEVFVFECDVQATDCRLDEMYLEKLAECDYYFGLIGREYGFRDLEGVSPTEREFDEASRLGQMRFLFVANVEDGRRDKREEEFLSKVSSELIWSNFSNCNELCGQVLKVLEKILADRKVSFSGESFESEECGRWEDLDETRLRWFVRTAREKRGFPVAENASAHEILMPLGMVGSSGNPRRAAMMCFGKLPLNYAFSCGVKCIEWYGTERAKPMGDYKWYQGDLFKVADDALEFIKRKMRLRIEGSNGGSQSNDVFELDERIVREAINNAIVHRDYTSTATVQVEFFADRLEVSNPGPMNKSMTYEMLFLPHKSYPNNPLIAHAMYLTKYIEDAGSGTIDILRICRENGLSDPQYTPLANDFTITIRRPRYDENGEKIAERIEKVAETHSIEREFAEFLIESGVRKDLRENMWKVFDVIGKNNVVTHDGLHEATGLSYGAVRNAINALKAHCLLRRNGSDTAGHWQTFFPPYVDDTERKDTPS